MRSLVPNMLTFRCNIQMKKEGRVVSWERELDYVNESTEMLDQNWREGARILPRRSGKGFFGSIGQQEIQII